MIMDFISKKVDRYRVILRTAQYDNFQHYLISLYDEAGRLFAQLLFTDFEDPKVVTRYGRVYFIYPKSDYAAAIDLLRNESPIYMVRDNQTTGGLRTRQEEVGEGERETEAGI